MRGKRERAEAQLPLERFCVWLFDEGEAEKKTGGKEGEKEEEEEEEPVKLGDEEAQIFLL